MPKRVVWEVFAENDVLHREAADDQALLGNLSYYELLKKFDKNEIQIADLNSRM